MSRLTVACVTAKPRSIRRSTSSCWLPIGGARTSSRIARWRSRFEPADGARCSATSDGRGRPSSTAIVAAARPRIRRLRRPIGWR